MRAALLILTVLAFTLAAPAAAAEDAWSCNVVRYEECPWPGGVGEVCAAGSREYRLCFGPI